MKKLIILLTAVTAMLNLTACTEINQDSESEPEIHVATIPVQAQEQAETHATQYAPMTEPSAGAPSETVPAEEPLPDETGSESDTNTLKLDTLFFDKAVFAAILDTISGDTVAYLANDLDGDTIPEFLISVSVAENSSQNILLEGIATSGLYYYDATGVANDFFVINPENGRALLNENTRNDDGEIISREYFLWQGDSWELISQLYGGNCYWEYQPTTREAFMANADLMESVGYPEDVFNILIYGRPEEIAREFYDYLSKYFSLSAPVSADIDGDGTMEQILVVQNLTKRWGNNTINLYGQENSNFDTEAMNNVHTTCFILDTTENGMTRIRSENFDRKYSFSVSGSRLYAYDDTNSMQTIQYSAVNDGKGKHFMSMMWG